MRQSRTGCSSLFAFLILAGLAVAIFFWPVFIDSRGIEAHSTVSEKREFIRIVGADWYRHFQILAAFSIPGQPSEHHAICNVDQQTYDSLHIGNPVTVHYIQSLLFQPLIPAANISPCSTFPSLNLNPSMVPKLSAALITLLVILFVGRMLRARLLRAVLLFAWFLLFTAYFIAPRAEPTPSDSRVAQATVETIETITSIPNNINSRHTFRLTHPFQIVRLQFTPPGMDTPVTVIDKVDLDSIPTLAPKQTVAISYDAANPRIAQIRGGTRLFPQHTITMLLIVGAIILGLFFALSVIRFVFRPFVRRPAVSRASRINALFQRNRRQQRGL